MNCFACGELTIVRTSYDTIVCTSCGVEKQIAMIPSCDDPYNRYNQLNFQYSRRQRFKNYLEQVCGISSGCNARANIWSLLKKKSPFEEIEDLLKCMAEVKCKHKHYECIHSFSRAFVTSYEKPDRITLDDQKFIMRKFDKILLRWKHHYEGTKELFFSYPWLTKHLLHSRGLTQFDCFLKKLQCKKRNSKYSNLLKTIMKPIQLDETPLQIGDDSKEEHRWRNMSASQWLFRDLSGF